MVPATEITFVYPPIPDRSCDYLCMLKDGDEETGIQGWGSTPLRAFQDFMDQYCEDMMEGYL